jgi:hypothetical protein
MKRHVTIIVVGVVLVVWSASDLLAQPGRRGRGGKPVAGALPKKSRKPAGFNGKAKSGPVKVAPTWRGSKPTRKPSGAKATLKPAGAKASAITGLKPNGLPGAPSGKGGATGLKPLGGSLSKPTFGSGTPGLKPKPGIGSALSSGTGGGPGLKPAISPKSIASKLPHGKPAIGPPLPWHWHSHPQHHHHHHHWHHWGYRPWVWATWPRLRAWIACPVRSVTYCYYVTNGYVYNGDTQVASVVQYAEQANEIAESAEELDEDAEWMSLGVFSVVAKENDDVEVTVQLALAKDGTIGGTYQNSAANVTLPLSGAVDETTQRAAWKIGEQDAVVMETGLENLTKEKSSVLLHFENGTTEAWTMIQAWTMIRMDEEAAKNAIEQVAGSSAVDQFTVSAGS